VTPQAYPKYIRLPTHNSGVVAFSSGGPALLASVAWRQSAATVNPEFLRRKTAVTAFRAGEPAEVVFDVLKPS